MSAPSAVHSALMQADKAEFKRLIEIMDWSQTEVARLLHKTPSAINHLVNPDHPNKPTQATLLLLKLIIARERPDVITAQTRELREAPKRAEPDAMRLSPREREMIESMRLLSHGEQEKIHAVIEALLRPTGRKAAKNRR